MENDTKKRKVENTEEKQEKGKQEIKELDLEGEQDDDDEVKMEKFFALIRSSRDISDQIRRRSSSDSKNKQEYKKVEAAAWNPSFQPEDFIQDFKDNQAAAGSSKRPEEKEEENEKKLEEEGGDNGLDLNLSL